jgi:hypothetical protein
MEIISHSVLPVAHLLWRPKAGRWIFTVVCKASFRLSPRVSYLAPEQEPPNPADTYWDNDERRSLYRACDIVPFKRCPEVVLTGSAYAPGGAPVTYLVARLAVGPVNKGVDIFGDRYFAPGGKLGAPGPFTRMPLVWERAAGGLGTANPVGVRMGDAATSDSWGRTAVPNLTRSGVAISRPQDTTEPVGFGPVAPHWPSRVNRLPHSAHAWDIRRFHLRPLPAGFDPWFFNVAPEDQQIPELHRDVHIVLEHLHAEHPRLDTILEPLAPRAVVDWAHGGRMNVELRCDTLAIDSDRGLASLTWRGHVPLEDPTRIGCVVVSLDRAEPATKIHIETAPIDVGLFTQPDANTNPLPFLSALPSSAPTLARSPSPASRAAVASAGETMTFTAPMVAAHASLPFKPSIDEPNDAILLRAPAPFLDLEAASPVTAIAPEASVTESSPSAELPLQTATVKPAEIAPPPLPLTDYPIERCAGIAASLARRPDNVRDLLAAHRLDQSRWDALRHHWDNAIRNEARRGRADLRRAHDLAFVGQLEQERGPITPEQYARLTVAAERNLRDEVLAALDLPREAVLPIERVYLARTVHDPKVRAHVRIALARARHVEAIDAK